MAAEEGSNRRNWKVPSSPEIVEIVEESKSMDEGFNDIYVAVGKNDLHIVKWALDHAVSPGKNRVFLVHVFPPITYIPTPGTVPTHPLCLSFYFFERYIL